MGLYFWPVCASLTKGLSRPLTSSGAQKLFRSASTVSSILASRRHCGVMRSMEHCDCENIRTSHLILKGKFHVYACQIDKRNLHYKPFAFKNFATSFGSPFGLRNFQTAQFLSNHYETLEVSTAASAKEIKSAFYKLSKEFHPDRNPGNRQAEEKFKALSAAYTVLSDPAKKKQYDFEMNSQQPRYQRRPVEEEQNPWSDEWRPQDEERLRAEQERVWQAMRDSDPNYARRWAEMNGFGQFYKDSQTKDGRRKFRPYPDYETYRRHRIRMGKIPLSTWQIFVRVFLVFFFMDLIFAGFGPRSFGSDDLYSPYQDRGPRR